MIWISVKTFCNVMIWITQRSTFIIEMTDKSNNVTEKEKLSWGIEKN